MQVQHCLNTHSDTDPQPDTRGLSDYNCMGLWPACKPSCPAAAVPMRVLRGRGAAGKLCVRACGPEEPNSIRIRIQLAARSSTTSGVVPLPLAVAHVVLVMLCVMLCRSCWRRTRRLKAKKKLRHETCF